MKKLKLIFATLLSVLFAFTGGMGTTILYVVGTILVLAAGILLVTKKRMDAK